MPVPFGCPSAPRRLPSALAVVGCCVGLLATSASPAAADERVSVDSAGVAGNGFDRSAAVNGDGSVVAFNSTSTNLVAGDANGVSDVFVRNRLTGQTRRVSVSSAGVEGNADSGGDFAAGAFTPEPAISADGTIVVFHSAADNLVPDDTNGLVDVFAHDLTTGQTTRVNVTSAGAQAVVTDPVGFQNEGFSFQPTISADGNTIVFRSTANNLVAGDTNRGDDIFAHDRLTGATTRVTPAASGGGYFSGSAMGPQLSADGQVVAFLSNSDIFAVELATGQLTRVSTNSAGTAGGNAFSLEPAISADGRYVSFISVATDLVAGDTNGMRDVFVRDRLNGATTRVSVSSSGAQADGHSFQPTAISADGRLVAFLSQASTLVAGRTGENVYTHDVLTGETRWIAEGSQPAISADGLTVAYSANGVFVATPDAEDPVVTAPADPAAVEATGPGGAAVSFDPATATDDVDADTTAPCTPASGSTFAVGATLVPCSYTDASGKTGTDTLTVTVVDTTAPDLDVPGDRTVAASGSDGAVVAYPAATATDLVDGAVDADCTPASGSRFPAGATTTVTCTAVDIAGNDATASFRVAVSPWVAPAPTVQPAPPTTRPTVKVTCTSRRVVRVTVPRRHAGRAVRSATVTIDGRRARVTRSGGRRIVRVDMRGRGRTTVPVTLTVRLQGGRTAVIERAFRTCRPGPG